MVESASERVDGFTLEALVAEDRRGRVYRARRDADGRAVFLRVFAPALAGGRRFRKEIETARRLAADLAHPNILPVVDAGMAGSAHYAAVPAVPGYSLRAWLNRKGRLPEKDVLTVAESIAAALGYAWTRRALVHGALSLDTIWVDADGTVRVGDLLGAAWRECGGAEAVADLYRAPEESGGPQRPDVRTDIYALGALISHLLTGRHPLARADAAPGRDAAAAAISSGCARLVELMTASDPLQRYGGWTAVTEDIRRVMAGALPYAIMVQTWRGDPVAAAMPAPAGEGRSAPPAWRRPWHLKLAWGVALLLVAGGTFRVRRDLLGEADALRLPRPPPPVAVPASAEVPAELKPDDELTFPRAADVPAPETIPLPVAMDEPPAPAPAEPAPAPPPAPEVPAPVPPTPAPAPALAPGYADYLAVFGRVLPLTRQRRYLDARQALLDWQAQHPGHGWLGRAREDTERITAVQRLFERLTQAAARLRGVTIRAGGEAVGAVEGVTNGALVVAWALREGRVEFRVPVTEVTEGDFARLLAAADPERHPLHVASYLVAAGDFTKALAWCDDATAAGLDAAGVRRWAGEWQAAERCDRAAKRLASIAALVDAGRFEEARRMLELAEGEFGETPVFAELQRERVAALRAAVAATRARGADDGYPGIPAGDLARLAEPAARAQVRRATELAAAKGLWQRHREAVDQTLVACTVPRAPSQVAAQFGRVLDSEPAALLLAQSAFIRAATPERLLRLGADDSSGIVGEFLAWALMRPAAVEAFLDTVKPEDDLDRALRLWSALWHGDSAGRESYVALAIATALVFDTPQKGIDPHERYRFLRDSADKRRLRTDLRELSAADLVWVVDAPLPVAELEWAQKHVNLAQRQWDQAYGMVRYRMEKAVSGETLYTEYTLANILKEGGICSDQAHFAAMTAKANGVPAMVIVGEGQRGGHAWFGYKASPRAWNLSAGRYAGDRFAAGTTRDPQTGRRLNEHELQLLADAQRRVSDYGRATRLVWLGRLVAERGLNDRARLAYEQALEASPRHLEALLTYIEFLKGADAPADTWDRVVRRMQSDFRDYPDVVQLANDLALERAALRGGADAAARELRQQARRLDNRYGARTDLLVANIAKQVETLLKAGDTNGVSSLYGEALRDYGHDVTAFKTLSARYFDFAEARGTRHEAMRRIESAFRRFHAEPTGDYFAMVTYGGLLNLVADFYARDEQEYKAERLRRKAQQLAERARERYD